MDPIFQIDLPFPPSVNKMYRYSRSHVSLTKRAKQFRSDVCLLVLDKCNRIDAPLPIVGEVEVEIIAKFPIDRSGDIDNLLKATLDALQAAKVFCNDSQVGRLLITRGNQEHVGRLIVSIGRYRREAA